jgi:hypothetical protein
LRQTTYFLGKCDSLANFPAWNSGAAVAALRPGVAEFTDFRPFLNRAKPLLHYEKPILDDDKPLLAE